MDTSLEKLSKEELLKLRDKIDVALHLSSDSRSRNQDEDLVYEALKRVFEKHYRVSIMPLVFIKKYSIHSNFTRTRKMFLELLEKMQLKQSYKIKRISYYEQFFEALRDYLIIIEVSVSLTSLLRNHANLGVALDMKFPGYLEAGMLGMVLDKQEDSYYESK